MNPGFPCVIWTFWSFINCHHDISPFIWKTHAIFVWGTCQLAYQQYIMPSVAWQKHKYIVVDLFGDLKNSPFLLFPSQHCSYSLYTWISFKSTETLKEPVESYLYSPYINTKFKPHSNQMVGVIQRCLSSPLSSICAWINPPLGPITWTQ